MAKAPQKAVQTTNYLIRILEALIVNHIKMPNSSSSSLKKAPKWMLFSDYSNEPKYFKVRTIWFVKEASLSYQVRTFTNCLPSAVVSKDVDKASNKVP